MKSRNNIRKENAINPEKDAMRPGIVGSYAIISDRKVGETVSAETVPEACSNLS